MNLRASKPTAGEQLAAIAKEPVSEAPPKTEPPGPYTPSPAVPAEANAETAAGKIHPRDRVLYGPTIGADGIVTAEHQAELDRIEARAKEANGRDPKFRQKNFTDWHGWCHWMACTARVQVALHQAKAVKWESRKRGKDAAKEATAKAKIEAYVAKINAQREAVGKPPISAEQASALLS